MKITLPPPSETRIAQALCALKDTSMDEATIHAQRAIVQNALRDGGKVLIVGVKPDNVGPDIYTNPRVIVFESMSGVDFRSIPQNVKVVLMTRFMKHETHTRLLREANKRNIHCINAFYNTGMLKKVLVEAHVIQSPDEEPDHADPEPELRAHSVEPTNGHASQPPEPVKVRHGDLKRFIHEVCARRWPREMPKYIESATQQSIYEEALRAGLGTTLLSVTQSVLNERKNRRREAERVATVNAHMNGFAHEIDRVITPPVVTPPANFSDEFKAPSQAPAVESPRARDLIAILNEAIVGLELAKERIASDYANFDVAVKAAVKERLKAVLSQED